MRDALLKEFRVFGFAAISDKKETLLSSYTLFDRLNTVAAMRDEILRPFSVGAKTTADKFNTMNGCKIKTLTKLLKTIEHSKDYNDWLEYAHGKLSVILDSYTEFNEDVFNWIVLSEDRQKEIMIDYSRMFVETANMANSFFGYDSIVEYTPPPFYFYNQPPRMSSKTGKPVEILRGFSEISGNERRIVINTHPLLIASPKNAIEVVHHEMVHDLGRQLGEKYLPQADNTKFGRLQNDAMIFYAMNKLGSIPTILREAYLAQAHEIAAYREGQVAAQLINDLLNEYIVERLTNITKKTNPPRIYEP